MTSEAKNTITEIETEINELMDTICTMRRLMRFAATTIDQVNAQDQIKVLTVRKNRLKRRLAMAKSLA